MAELQTFTCAVCKVVFESDRSDEEVIAELSELFGEWPVEACAVICDDCFKKMESRFRAAVRFLGVKEVPSA